MYNLERLTPDIQETGLAISDIDFLAKKVAGDHVNIQTDVYFTNDNRAASGQAAGFYESIQPDATKVSSVTLSVPDQYNYVVEVLVWKNDTIVKRGEGNVRLRPGMQVDKDTQFMTKQIETSKFVQDSGSPARTPAPYTTAKSPGFGAPLVVIALVSLAGLMLTGRRRP